MKIWVFSFYGTMPPYFCILGHFPTLQDSLWNEELRDTNSRSLLATLLCYESTLWLSHRFWSSTEQPDISVELLLWCLSMWMREFCACMWNNWWYLKANKALHGVHLCSWTIVRSNLGHCKSAGFRFPTVTGWQKQTTFLSGQFLSWAHFWSGHFLWPNLWGTVVLVPVAVLLMK